MLADILESTKQTLTERLASPILGSFLVSWCLWNWKFLVILLSDATVSQTFTLAENICFPNLYTLLTRCALYPLLTSAAYIFIYPYPSLWVYAFTLRRQREINQAKQQIANETPLTIEESRKLRAEYVEHERRNTEIVERLNDEIVRLKAALEADKNVEVLAPLSDTEKMYDNLEPSQLKTLRLLEELGGASLESQLIAKSSEKKVKTEFDLGELERRKLITRRYDRGQGEFSFEFTHDGRRALLKSPPF